MNIIIDSYFLDLEDEEEIRTNLSYFQDLIFLCNSGKIKIHLYKELINKLLERNVIPFPIKVWNINDINLRTAIIKLNDAFSKVVMQNIQPIDIDECGGKQCFEVLSDQEDIKTQLLADEKYYELLFVLLQNCYNDQINLSTCIVTGEIKKGRNIGDEFILKCKCDKSFEETYRFCLIDEFKSDQDIALKRLDELNKTEKICDVKSPIIVRAQHHNKLQKNSDFKTFEGLSRANKAVLTLLRKFGLKKIIFGECHNNTTKVTGTITIDDIQKTRDVDILKGWLYAETGYINHVDLYFPKDVGENLRIYLKSEFNKVNVGRLIDSLVL